MIDNNPQKSQPEDKRRPNIVITDNYIRPQSISTVPGNRTYASMTKYGKKTCIVGDSRIKKVRRNIVNNSIANGNAYLKYFSGAKVRHLDHFIESTLSENQPGKVILHIGSNDMTNRNVEDINISTIADEVISTGKKCAMFVAKNVVTL